jgi:hypothetical protein
MGWAGLENGALLASAASAGFDALLTKDAKLQYEQNLTDLPIAVVILHARSNDMDDIRPLIAPLLTALASLRSKAITHVP